MHIGIDGRFFGPTGTGIGRYTQKLIEHLEQIDTDNTYTVLLRQENFDQYTPQNPNFKKILADFPWYGFKEQLLLPPLLYKHTFDLFHFTNFNLPIFYQRPFVVTVHDLILINFPTRRATTRNKLFYDIKYAGYKQVFRYGVTRSRAILATSTATKNDILSHYPIEAEKIAVTYQASEPQKEECNPQNDAKILANYGILGQYILYVGNAYPHKNLERLVGAYGNSSLRAQGVSLVLVGKEDYFYARLKDYVRTQGIDGVRFAGFVPDAELGTFYRNALFYVFPSLCEGFGLPPLEAMQYGLPVLSSDHACLREVLGNAASFFSAANQDAIGAALEDFYRNPERRNALRKIGFEQVAKYDWRRLAQETRNVYEQFAAKQDRS